MPRRKRFQGAHVCQHIYDRGNNKQRIFHDEKDCAAFIYRAFAFAEEAEIAIHAWVLMRNHFHLLLTPTQPNTISLFMQKLKGSYTQHYNTKYESTGTISAQVNFPLMSYRRLVNLAAAEQDKKGGAVQGLHPPQTQD